jgi:hypothetical protein
MRNDAPQRGMSVGVGSGNLTCANSYRRGRPGSALMCACATWPTRAEPSIGWIAHLTDQSCRESAANDTAARRVLDTSSP